MLATLPGAGAVEERSSHVWGHSSELSAELCSSIGCLPTQVTVLVSFGQFNNPDVKAVTQYLYAKLASLIKKAEL